MFEKPVPSGRLFRVGSQVGGRQPTLRPRSLKTRTPASRETGVLIGRSRVIRTLDPLLPKQVRYQAALYSVRSPTRARSAGSEPARRALSAALYSCGLPSV